MPLIHFQFLKEGKDAVTKLNSKEYKQFSIKTNKKFNKYNKLIDFVSDLCDNAYHIYIVDG